MSENKQRDTFIFYRSFKESMNDLSDADKLIMYEAISDYSLDMKEPELTGFPKALFSLIRPVLDANTKRWQNGCKGGASSESLKGNQNARKRTKNEPDSNQKRTKNKANKDKDVDKDKNIDKEKIVKEKNISLSDRTEKFKEELTPFVEKYCKDMIFAFFDYWSEPDKTKTKMRCELQKTWSTAGRLRTWERRLSEKR